MIQHNKQSDCWIILDVDGEPKAVDVTKYMNDHPGGAEVILEYAGADASSMFDDIGHSSEARASMKKLVIGNVQVSEDKAKQRAVAKAKGGKGSESVRMILFLLVAIVGAYFYLNK